ncbi:Dam family site-specific DNA-(adenine-N6)-methyltransferase [Sulfobacillus thermosulfidooxidans]|uniref:Dam family site-specific DNA-(adenine-N6)-methyltransferase n=1 Tax=Sulfobacillus thermosulfidooxidans TaxID=28034 RepID=UPI000403CC94|nr:Dam family site-specific DNA-(adenine-N6)-methyltransferase [Sulfobacillus thermosulfidooxidans]
MTRVTFQPTFLDAPQQTNSPSRPFLKWAGGKARLTPIIRTQLPAGRRLIEPFAGSAAVWLATDYPSAIVADINEDLIHLYQTLQVEGPSFIDYCRTFFTPEMNTAEAYYACRERFNTTKDQREKSALFLYLNRHGYNGLCRYNAAGRFNVPFGRYRRPYFPATEMHRFWEKSRTATFVVGDFRTILAQAQFGDVVYCDPPYVPLSSTANFTDYAGEGFGEVEHEALAWWARHLADQGIPVVISNHATPWTRELYKTATQLIVSVPRFISCDGKRRESVDEVLALFGR